jgi:hypothetical protein
MQSAENSIESWLYIQKLVAVNRIILSCQDTNRTPKRRTEVTPDGGDVSDIPSPDDGIDEVNKARQEDACRADEYSDVGRPPEGWKRHEHEECSDACSRGVYS